MRFYHVLVMFCSRVLSLSPNLMCFVQVGKHSTFMPFFCFCLWWFIFYMFCLFVVKLPITITTVHARACTNVPGSKLLPWIISSSRFSCGLFCYGHCDKYSNKLSWILKKKACLMIDNYFFFFKFSNSNKTTGVKFLKQTLRVSSNSENFEIVPLFTNAWLNIFLFSH